jgi:hypothetical protein
MTKTPAELAGMISRRTDFTTNQKLDSVLKYLNHEGSLLDDVPIIVDKIDFKSDAKEVSLILWRLVKDGNAQSIEDHTGILGTQYTITLDGKILIESGGYENKQKKENRTATLQLTQTWSIAIATGIIALEPICKGILWLLHHCLF